VTNRLPLPRPARPALLILLGLLFAALIAPAAASAKTETFRVGPIGVGGYEVKQGIMAGIPKPQVDGHITGMEVDIVDESGTPVPIQRLMLHHIVFLNLSRSDRTCQSFLDFGDRPFPPSFARERFYAAGEERATLAFPPGYGYRTGAGEGWALTYMVMNHRPSTDRAYIQYTVTYQTDHGSEDVQDVDPYWLDVRNCRADPIYNVPGTGRRGSTHRATYDFTMPVPGRLIAGGGHVHGGARRLELRQPGCGNRLIARSDPTWGLPSHSFYRVRPILHEPGPINMSGFGTRRGIPLAAGETIRLRSLYDNSLPHTRVMGIMVVYVAPDPSVAGRCGAIPADLGYQRTAQAGRRGFVPFRIPLIGLNDRGRAVPIQKPPGPTRRAGNNATITVGDRFFARPNLVVKRGTKLRWRFSGAELHNITLANGPVGIGSPNLDANRVYSRKFGRAGTYNFFCALHPVQMHQRVVVKKRR
jgi:plastocyanin